MPVNKETGSALLTALFLMTLVAIVATAMSTKLQMDIYRTRTLINYDKLYMVSQAVTFWSLGVLNEKKPPLILLNKQGMVANFPQNRLFISKQVQLSGGLYDLQARLNINNLIDKKYISVFVNLLGQIYQNSMSTERNNLALTIKNWLSNYDLAQGTDGYASYYQSQQFPYNPSHQLLSSTSELRLIKDISSPLYLMLAPYVTTLPEITAININTASKRVLMSLGNGLNENKVNEILSLRADKGRVKSKDLNKLIDSLNLPREQVTLESNYFLSIAYLQNEDLGLVVYTLFKRNKNKKNAVSVQLIRQSINTW